MISFIIPVYKKPLKTFKKCLDHLYDMSVKDIEIITVFDGPDAILESYADKMAKDHGNLKKIVIEHGGACKARNAGFKESKGDIVAFWDSDCYAVPEMARVWEDYFKKHTEATFLYSGYKWTDPTIPGYQSEPFDPWILKKYNYICTMSPIRREKVLEWDEALEGLQDWDYFRRVVDAGGIGVYIPCGQNAVSAGFETDLPDKESISGAGREKFIQRHNAIKKKHGDVESDMLVYGRVLGNEAKIVAKLLNADYFVNPIWITKEYDAALCIGFNTNDADVAATSLSAAGPEAKRIMWWPGMDVVNISYGPYVQVKDLIEKMNKHIDIHLCDDIKTKNDLENLGIKATARSLPKAHGEVLKHFPIAFKILAFADPEMEPHLDSVIRSLPDVDIDKMEYGKNYEYSDYTMGIHLSDDGRLNTSSKNMLLHGRYLLSNAQEPFSGYVDTGNLDKFKREMVEKIREIQERAKWDGDVSICAPFMSQPYFNKEAQDYYLEELNPERFKAFIESLCVLEVVNA